MSSYAQVSDLIDYTSLTLNTPDENLPTLINNAERDIDTMFNPSVLTNALMGIQMSGVEDGDFAASLTWQGSVFTSGPIQWNAVEDDVIAALNSMENVLGDKILGPAWQVPVTPTAAPDWAGGPLPFIPVVVEAVGYLAQQALPLLTTVSNLTGSTPTVKVISFRGGGVRYDIWQLQPFQVLALRNATCAQAEYRDQMGEDFYVRAQWDAVHGPEFQTTGKLPIIGPKVHRELQGSGLVQYSARASVGARGNMATALSRMGGTPIPDDWRAV